MIKKFLIFIIFCIYNPHVTADIVNGYSDTVGRPRDLSLNPIYVGFDHSQTTSIINHNLTHLSGSETLVTFTTSSHLILQNTTLSLDGTFTFSHGTIDIVGTVNIEGSGQEFYFNSVFLRINSGSRLRIGDGVTFIYTPTSKLKGAIQFDDDSGIFELDGATLKVSNDFGLQMNIGTLEINGNSIIDNITSDTTLALILGYGTATNTDGPLRINSDARLTVKKAGLILRNLGSLQGDGALIVEPSGNFIIEQNLDLDGNNLNFDFSKLSSKIGTGIIESVDDPELYGANIATSINTLDWRLQADYLAVVKVATWEIYDPTLNQIISLASGSGQTRIVNWDPYGRYIATSQTEAIKGILNFNEGHQALYLFDSVNNGIATFTFDVKFSPSGRYLLFPGIEGSSTDMLYLYKFLPEESTKLELATTIQIDSNALFEWSPNGRYIAVMPKSGAAYRIYDFNETPTTNLITSVSSNTVTGQHGKSIWSPDGRHFAICRTISPYVIVYNFDGTTATEVASMTTDIAGSLAWAPDGRAITVAEITGEFSVLKFDGNSLTRLNIGGSISPVDLGTTIRCVSWAPNRRIAFGRGFDATAGENEILIYDVNCSTQPAETSLQNVESLKLKKNLVLKDILLKLG
ncbi:hypothetical protein KAW80_00040 [Candidatus Babeliales bacterium]|nr:hypothetical protein [Candidatus Babeliales bacterium]